MSVTAAVLTATKELDRTQWLEWRKQGIGGSDAAAVAGLSKYKSPTAVYLEKIGDLEPEEAGESAYWGTVLEDLIAREFTKRTGLIARRRNAILRHPQYPFMIANIDRFTTDPKEGRGVLEIKTTSEYLRDDWAEDKVPDAYMVQMQHYLAVTGLNFGYIAVLIGGNKYRHIYVPRDEAIISYLIQIESAFWERVEKRIPPELDGSEASSEVLSVLYPKGDPGAQVTLSVEAEHLVRQFQEAQEAEKAAGLLKDEAANKLKALLGDNEVGLIAGKPRVFWKSVESQRLDSQALKTAEPATYSKYLKPSLSRRFSVK